MLAIDFTTYSLSDLATLAAQVLAEQQRRNTVANGAAQATSIANAYAAAVAGQAAVDGGGTIPTSGWGPGQAVTFSGTVYVNQSGAWLSANPTQYPMGWRLQTAPSASPWAAGTAYKVGDLAAYQGTTYKCLQAHTSQVGWEPPNVPALWAVA